MSDISDDDIDEIGIPDAKDFIKSNLKKLYNNFVNQLENIFFDFEPEDSPEICLYVNNKLKEYKHFKLLLKSLEEKNYMVTLVSKGNGFILKIGWEHLTDDKNISE